MSLSAGALIVGAPGKKKRGRRAKAQAASPAADSPGAGKGAVACKKNCPHGGALSPEWPDILCEVPSRPTRRPPLPVRSDSVK